MRPSPAALPASSGTVVPEVRTPLAGGLREVEGAALPVLLLLFVVFIWVFPVFPGVMQLWVADPCVFAHVLAKLQFLREFADVVLRLDRIKELLVVTGGRSGDDVLKSVTYSVFLG
jgi:hypothetical protein